MYLDAQQLYSDAQALTASAASTNIIDHEADFNLGSGEEMSVVIVLDVAADNTTTDETYVAALEVDDNSGFSSASSLGSVTIPAGSAAGSKFFISVPKGSDFEQYSRVYFTLGGTTPTVTVTTFLQPSKLVQDEQNYPDNITIS